MKRLPARGSLISSLLGIWVLGLIPGQAAKSQTPQAFIDSLVNQKLILRHFGDVKEAKLRKDKLADARGTCDVAVLVRRASWDNGRVRLQWEQIGSPYVSGKPRSICNNKGVRRTHLTEGSIEISEFASDEPVGSLAGSLSLILQTPDQYLVTEGIAFNPQLQPSLDNPRPTPSQSVTPPQVLLQVEPAFSENALKAKYQGVVTMSVNLGADGRIHQANVIKKLGLGLDEMALNVIPMWRFEPARKLDKSVTVQMLIEIDFRLY
jgi:TonB family protein